MKKITTKKYNAMIEALKYCAAHAHPSIVADVAKAALKGKTLK